MHNQLVNIYLIKDLARISGHSTHTLKYYLRLGLIAEMGRSPVTNFRYFNDSTLERLIQIRRLQSGGLSLKEIYEQLNQK